jgi:hypothetical protein
MGDCISYFLHIDCLCSVRTWSYSKSDGAMEGVEDEVTAMASATPFAPVPFLAPTHGESTRRWPLSSLAGRKAGPNRVRQVGPRGGESRVGASAATGSSIEARTWRRWFLGGAASSTRSRGATRSWRLQISCSAATSTVSTAAGWS